jgi:two-component system sensor histidine kinase HydH
MASIRAGESGESEDRLSFASALRDSLVSGVIVLDSQKRILARTGPIEEILGGPLPVGTPASRLPEPLQQLAHDVQDSGELAATRAAEIAIAGRGTVMLRVTVVPCGTAGTEPGLVLMLTDLTSIAGFERQIQQLDRLANLGTLAASMAHEIKNALVAGRTFIDLLLEKNQDAELVEVVRRELGRINDMVGRMLKLAEPASGALQEVHVNQVLEHLLRVMEPQLKSKSIILNRSLCAAADSVKGDEHELQEAFLNLLLNAVEAMGPDGTLSVASEAMMDSGDAGALREQSAAPQLRVVITDTGIGIPPENMGRLFHPFFTTKPTGTGLGLAITQRIVRHHKGRITVESQPGRGTSFGILLPVYTGTA